ncbi:hypothetical protein L3V83_11205 [Thiotrichales bacterium 19X7-9]|nr:hypothetical protein [Thiotrichales bacterium 19X7-9]
MMYKILKLVLLLTLILQANEVFASRYYGIKINNNTNYNFHIDDAKIISKEGNGERYTNSSYSQYLMGETILTNSHQVLVYRSQHDKGGDTRVRGTLTLNSSIGDIKIDINVDDLSTPELTYINNVASPAMLKVTTQKFDKDRADADSLQLEAEVTIETKKLGIVTIGLGDCVITEDFGKVNTPPYKLDINGNYNISFTKANGKCTVMHGMISCPSDITYQNINDTLFFACRGGSCPWVTNTDSLTNSATNPVAIY